MRFIKLNICIALSCCLFTACSNDDEKWEPEMAVPLAFFEVDVSQYLRIDTFTIHFFSKVITSPGMRDTALRKAIGSLDLQDKSAREGLSSHLRSDMDAFFLNDKDKKRSDLLLEELLNAFRDNKHFFAINSFAYEIVTEALRMNSTLKPKFEEILPDSVNFSNEITIETGDFSKNIEQIRRIELQLDVRSQLDVDADVQLMMVGSNTVLANFDVTLPIGESKQSPQAHAYEQGDARKIIQQLDKVVFKVSSEELGLTLEKIKDLHDKKISATMSLKIKMAINDNNAGE
jgi:hypothetical protein